MAFWTPLAAWWDWLVQFIAAAGPTAGAAFMLVPLLVGGILGVWLGWRSGRQAGAREGMAATPLFLKEEAFRQGRCPVCAQEARDPGPSLPLQSLRQNLPQ